MKFEGVTIAGRKIGRDQPCFIVAELSGNHHKSLDTAVQLIHAAKLAGADAVKTQCFEPDTMTLNSDTRPFRLMWAGKERTLWDLYTETAMPLQWHKPLKILAESLGMIYFASVFSPADVDFMSWTDVCAYKIASFELTDLPLIRYTARRGKPIFLSTGMANRTEILAAIRTADEGIRDRIYLPENKALAQPASIITLKCVSAYPASISDSNLQMIAKLGEVTGRPVGLSDHTLGTIVPTVAVLLGACVVEKHLTLSRNDGGPDAAFSLEPHEFKAMVESVREVEQALGEIRFGPTENEQANLHYRRSLWVIKDVKAGERFTTDNLKSLRPADGLAPRYYDDVIGQEALSDILAGTALGPEMVWLD